MLEKTPYKAPSDAFVEYFPFSRLLLAEAADAKDVGKFIFYLCLKSTNKEELGSVIVRLVTGDTEALAEALIELCLADDWYEPLLLLSLELITREMNEEVDGVLAACSQVKEIPQKVTDEIFFVLMDDKNFLGSLVNDGRTGIKSFIEEKAPIKDLLKFMAYGAQTDYYELDLTTMPKARQYELIRTYLKSHISSTPVQTMIAYLKNAVAEGHNYYWFGRGFGFNRNTYVRYFGEDDVLTTIENL